jgi:dTDP-4-amino-4,6-dideoxygalactose transaminase
VVFCDTDPETFTIDPRAAEAKVTSRTVGIVPVHLFGQPADMDPILETARRHGLWVVEDCAQAHMATYRGRRVGTMGDAAAFSFYPSKNLGAMGDAGCLVTNDARLARWCEAYARHGGKGEHVMEGVNSRLDGLQAAVLLAKLPHLDAWTEGRQRVAALYDRLLAGIDAVKTPTTADGRSHVFHLYVVRVARREALRAHLAAHGIETALNYPKALPFYPAYAHLNHSERDFPVAARHQREVLSLPMYPELTGEQVSSVVEHLSGFFEAPGRASASSGPRPGEGL